MWKSGEYEIRREKLEEVPSNGFSGYSFALPHHVTANIPTNNISIIPLPLITKGNTSRLLDKRCYLHSSSKTVLLSSRLQSMKVLGASSRRVVCHSTYTLTTMLFFLEKVVVLLGPLSWILDKGCNNLFIVPQNLG